MKKIFGFGFIFLIFSFNIWGQAEQATDKDLSFYLQLDSSYKNQVFKDYYFESPDRLKSRLDWESDYLFNLGLAVGIKIRGWEFFLSSQFSLPFECGKMYDSDWKTPGMKTNYSTSDLYTAFGNDSLLGIKYNFPLEKTHTKFYFSPEIIISNSYIRYNAKSTIGWCGDISHTHLSQDYPWDSPYATKWRKYGIDLTNNITCLFAGLEVSNYTGAFITKAGLLFSPYIYIFSIDHHIKKEPGYYMMIQEASVAVWDFYLKTGYAINKKNSIILAFDYSFCPGIDGSVYRGFTKDKFEKALETSSFSFKKFTTTLSWQISF